MARVDGLAYQSQRDFAAGAFPGLEAIPANGVEDIVNGVITQDHAVRRRGASTVKSNADTSGNVISLWDGFLFGGRRTLIQSTGAVYGLSTTDDATPQQIAGSIVGRPGRWTVANRMAFRPQVQPNQGSLVLWAGAAPFTAVNAGTATFTPGSNAVDGAGVDWIAAGVQPGSLIVATGTGLGRAGIVHDVQTSTRIVLVDPWQYSAQTAGAYSIQAAYTFTIPGGDAIVASQPHDVFLAQIYQRLVLANGNRISYSDFITDTGGGGAQVPAPLNFGAAEAYELLPDGVIVTGVEPLRDVLLIFTTAGVWGLYGLALDITDAYGNPQHRLERITRELVLWGEAGLASWRNAVIVPAVDDVMLFDGVGSPQPITGGARNLYRSYVKAGYQPGQAVVHRGHYVLPILDGSLGWVDTLLWRLDMAGMPLARWAGHGGTVRALVVRGDEAQRTPALLAGIGARVEDATGVFDAATGATDSDGSSYDLKVTTRLLESDDYVASTWRRFRARVESSSVPSVSLEYALGIDGAFTAAGTPGSRVIGSERVYSWTLARRARGLRLRLTVGSGGATLRALEAGARPSGHYRP